MSVRIRLQRFGRKKRPYFHIVVADKRSPRDGRYIENIGFYDPSTNPATIELDNQKAVKWLMNGAQPSDTAKAILSYKGVLMQKHLAIGVAKGKVTQEEADARLAEWIKAKQAKIDAKIASLAQATEKAKKDAHAAEVKINEERARALIEKRNQMAKELEDAAKKSAEEAKAAQSPAAEAGDTPAEVVDGATATEATTEDATEATTEAPAEEPKTEAAEEPKAEEAPKAEAADATSAEAPAEEPKAEEQASEEAPAEEKKDN